MANINATTPQLKFLKNLLDAYLTLDINKVEPFISKDFKFQTFPKIADLPDEAKEGHFERYGTLFSLMARTEANVHEVIEAPGKVVFHLSVAYHTVDGDVLDYDTLSVITLLEEDGELKISHAKDFSDPEKRNKFHAWATKALAKRAT